MLTELLHLVGTLSVLGLAVLVLVGCSRFPADSRTARLYMRTSRLQALLFLIASMIRFVAVPCHLMTMAESTVLTGLFCVGAFFHTLVIWLSADGGSDAGRR